jgi:hypothetical protein
MTQTYAVIYRSGGTHRCTWTRCLVRFTELQKAFDLKEELERMGYKALALRTEVLEAIGMPIGWEANSVDFEKDVVEVNQFQTFHEKVYQEAV